MAAMTVEILLVVGGFNMERCGIDLVNVQDTNHFLDMIRSLPIHLLPEIIIASVDVSSLYTNIPHMHDLSALDHFLNQYPPLYTIYPHPQLLLELPSLPPGQKHGHGHPFCLLLYQTFHGLS